MSYFEEYAKVIKDSVVHIVQYYYVVFIKIKLKFSMNEENLVRVGDANEGSHKNKKTVDKKTRAKLKRYSTPVGCRVFVPCKHMNKDMTCALVRPIDAIFVRNILYKIPDKNTQDNTIASWINQRNIKRRRPTSEKSKAKSFSVQYSILLSTVNYVDIDYSLWITWFLAPLIITFLLPAVIALLLYCSAFMLYIYKLHWKSIKRTLKTGDKWDAARKSVGALWDAHGWIWHVQ
ncbi:unnamed protein product [Diabrotica balteata]|uniref:Uncharacterized protein n=1 Tax=Diabrotica balteata TaxID=107213 RepID=A0A9N9STR5_DIABA|nr:unnamed protein product [Diabrotica balteata]